MALRMHTEHHDQQLSMTGTLPSHPRLHVPMHACHTVFMHPALRSDLPEPIVWAKQRAKQKGPCGSHMS